jgi:hypothetical protein
LANIIGFFGKDRRYKWQDDGWELPEPEYKYCPIHPANRLIHFSGENPDILRCPKCGISYNEYKTEGDTKKPKRHVVRK